MKHKQAERTINAAALILIGICLVGIGAVWVIMSQPAAETAIDSAGADLVPDPFTGVEDKLEFAAEVFDMHGYLVLANSVNLAERTAEYTIVPTARENELHELVISLETELWDRYEWEFQTEYREDELGAKISLTSEEYGFGLHLKQMTPNTRVVDDRPMLAIVIDDWGYSSLYADAFLQYPFSLTVAIIPHLPQSVRLAELAAENGHEVILHQPMEALNSHLDLGRGGIRTSMDAAEIKQRLQENIAHLPMIVGVNNHMGSKVTADTETMEIILAEIKDHGLYFLDSYTTPLSVAGKVAAEVGLPYAVNNLFIDNINEVEAVKKQLRQIMERAVLHGSAIAIGHVRSATAVALWEMIPEFVAADINLVPVSQLLIRPESKAAEDLDPAD